MSDTEQLSQDEIDRLLDGYKTGETVDISSQRLGGTDAAKKLDRALTRTTSRVAFYRENGYPHELIRSAEQELRRIGFKRWLYCHNLDVRGYVLLVRKILKERGLEWCPWAPPGYKLMNKETLEKLGIHINPKG